MKNNYVGLTPEAISTLQEVKKREESGEDLDPHTVEALKAINLASKIVNTIMAGNQIDPVFFKKLSDLTQQRIENAGKITQKKILKKKKKFKKKVNK